MCFSTAERKWSSLLQRIHGWIDWDWLPSPVSWFLQQDWCPSFFILFLYGIQLTYWMHKYLRIPKTNSGDRRRKVSTWSYVWVFLLWYRSFTVGLKNMFSFEHRFPVLICRINLQYEINYLALHYLSCNDPHLKPVLLSRAAFIIILASELKSPC